MTNKISIIMTSGNRESLQMAAMIASVGAVSGNAVRVLLSMNAITYFTKGNQDVAPAEGECGKRLEKAPHFKTLIEQAVEYGDAEIVPCPMAMDVFGLDEADMESYIKAPMGLTKFLDLAQDGQVWSF